MIMVSHYAIMRFRPIDKDSVSRSQLSSLLEIIRYAGLIREWDVNSKGVVVVILARPKDMSFEFWKKCVKPKAESHGFRFDLCERVPTLRDELEK